MDIFRVALVGVLVHGQVGGFGVDLVVCDGGGGGAGVGFGGGELGRLRGDLGEDLLLVELGEDLALFDLGVDVGVEAGDDAGGLGFDLDLGDGLDLAGCDYGVGDIAEFGLAQLRGLNLVVLPRAATAMPRTTTTTRAMRPVQSQILRLFLRCVAKGCSRSSG